MLSRLRDDSGVAMIVVLFAIVVVSVMGSALVISGVRDLDSSISVQRASTALGIAEAGVQHVIQQLKTAGPIGADIVRCQPDASAGVTDPTTGAVRNGWGQFMNPADRTLPPVFNALDTGTPPTNCGPFIGEVGRGRYTVYSAAVSANELITLPGERIGTYVVRAVGFDRRDRPGRPGERTVEQNLRIETVDVPYSLFAKSSVSMFGTPRVINESIYTGGDFFWRSQVTFQTLTSDPDCPYPLGCDLYYGWEPSEGKCSASPGPPGNPCPVAANAVGTIYKGGGGGGVNGPIHQDGPSECSYPYDRDADAPGPGGGGPYASWNPPPSTTWDCGPSNPAPPFSTSRFTVDDLPFNANGPTEDVYQFLKAIAKSTNTYCDHRTGSIQVGAASTGFGGDCEHLNDFASRIPPDKFFVMYFDSGPTAGAVSIKAGWGPQPLPGQNPADLPCDKSFGVVVLRGENRVLAYDNNEAWWGAMFVPEGTLDARGIGNTWFIGTAFAKNLNVSGNMRFQLNDCWLESVASPAFWLVNRLRWHEADR